MKTSAHSRLLACLLLPSLAANGWLWLRLRSTQNAAAHKHAPLAARPFQPAPPPSITPPASQPPPATESAAPPPDTAAAATSRTASALPLETAPVDGLLYGQIAPPEKLPVDASPRHSVTQQRLQELAQARPDAAEACEVHGRLLLPGERWVDFTPQTISARPHPALGHDARISLSQQL